MGQPRRGRRTRQIIAALVAATVPLALSSCADVVDGAARADLSQPGVAVTEDGAGIVAGAADAPVQIEIFTEPQCSHCADLQFDYGTELKEHMTSGRLAVTYRPVTFLDLASGTDYSEVVTNAMFLAVDPGTVAGQFQTFVGELWATQNLAFNDYTDEDFARIARSSGLADSVADAIGAGTAAVDPYDVDDVNSALLYDVVGNIQTPVVYDLHEETVVDIADEDWLDELMRDA